MKPVLMALILAVLPTTAKANRRNTQLEDDVRLNQKVSIREPGEQLSTILENLRKMTGVDLSADAPMGDMVLVIRYDGTIDSFMGQLSRFFAASPSHRPIWFISGQDQKKYRLQRDVLTCDRVTALREHRDHEYRERLTLISQCKYYRAKQWDAYKGPVAASALKEAIRRSALGGKVVQHFLKLSKGYQDHILSGGVVSFRVRDLTDDPTGYVRDWMDGSAPIDPDPDATMSFWSVGHGCQRGIFMRLDQLKTGISSATGICGFHLFDDWAHADQSKDWRVQLGVNATAPEIEFTFPADTKDQSTKGQQLRENTYRHEFWRVAEAAEINFIAEDHGWVARQVPVVGKAKLDEVMDRLCQAPPNFIVRDGGNGYFWWNSGETYMLRSLSWPEDEQLIIPQASVARWKEVRKKFGVLQIDTLLEMASLDRDVLPLLTIWFPEGKDLRSMQTLLRWIGRAPAPVRQSAQSMRGVSLTDLGIDYQEAMRDQDPSCTNEGTWKWLLQIKTPAEINLSLQTGPIKAPNEPERLWVIATFYVPSAADPNMVRQFGMPLSPAP